MQLSRDELCALSTLVQASWSASDNAEKKGFRHEAMVISRARDTMREVLYRAGVWK